MIGRRLFIAGLAGSAMAAPFSKAFAAGSVPPGVPANGALVFKVVRKGLHLGEHAVRFQQEGDALNVQIDVLLQVKLGPVTAYRYKQHCTERWVGGRFDSLDCMTQDKHVAAHRAADGVHVDPAKGPSFVMPADATPLTHWNMQSYQGPQFSPQSGEVMRENLVSKSADMVKLADGSQVPATRYSLSGDGVMDDFYDAGGIWTGLHAKVEDGSFVSYLRT